MPPPLMPLRQHRRQSRPLLGRLGPKPRRKGPWLQLLRLIFRRAPQCFRNELRRRRKPPERSRKSERCKWSVGSLVSASWSRSRAMLGCMYLTRCSCKLTREGVCERCSTNTQWQTYPHVANTVHSDHSRRAVDRIALHGRQSYRTSKRYIPGCTVWLSWYLLTYVHHQPPPQSERAACPSPHTVQFRQLTTVNLLPLRRCRSDACGSKAITVSSFAVGVASTCTLLPSTSPREQRLVPPLSGLT